MNSVISGTVINKEKSCIYLDTKNCGTWDKIIVCDASRRLHSGRLDNTNVGYNEIYKLIKVGDHVAFPVNLNPELLPNTRMVKCGNLNGEPIINGRKSLTILMENQAKEQIKQLSKDADYDMTRMLQYIQNFIYNKQK